VFQRTAACPTSASSACRKKKGGGEKEQTLKITPMLPETSKKISAQEHQGLLSFTFIEVTLRNREKKKVSSLEYLVEDFFPVVVVVVAVDVFNSS